MDPAIWSTLPQNLLELIMVRLHFPALLRLRLLSRHWRTQLTAPSFQHAFRDRRPLSFAVVENNRLEPKRVWVVDAMASKWHRVPLHSLPSSYVVAADGGLLCFVKHGTVKERLDLQMIVCNPITCTWRELPSVKAVVQLIPGAVQMKVNVETREYTIKFLGSHDIHYIYSSMTNSWTRQDSSSQPNANANVNVFHGIIRTYDIQPGASSSILYMPEFEHEMEAKLDRLFFLKTHVEREVREEIQGAKSKGELLCRIPKAAELENYFFIVCLCGKLIMLLGLKRHLSSRDTNDESAGNNNNNLMLILDMGTKTWTNVTDQCMDLASLLFSRLVVELRLDAIP